MTIEAQTPPAIVQPITALARAHQIRFESLLEHVRFHAASLDHHWAELAGAGLDLNRLMDASGTATPAEIRTLRGALGEYVRNSIGSAQLALSAAAAKQSLVTHNTGALRHP